MSILIVEDEPFIALDLADHVTDAGGQVAGPFARVSLAVDYLRSHEVAGAILDANLVDGNIDALAEGLCALGKPMIFYTGRGISDRLRALCNRATVITKPEPPANVVEALVKAMEKTGAFPARD